MGCTVMQFHCCLATRGSRVQILITGLSAWSLHVLSVHAWKIIDFITLYPNTQHVFLHLQMYFIILMALYTSLDISFLMTSFVPTSPKPPLPKVMNS